jgi:hypothetical protein
LIEATGRCPPEDIDDPWGNPEFLDAIRAPSTNGKSPTSSIRTSSILTSSPQKSPRCETLVSKPHHAAPSTPVNRDAHRMVAPHHAEVTRSSQISPWQWLVREARVQLAQTSRDLL